MNLGRMAGTRAAAAQICCISRKSAAKPASAPLSGKQCIEPSFNRATPLFRLFYQA
jgi:hypothetical protein